MNNYVGWFGWYTLCVYVLWILIEYTMTNYGLSVFLLGTLWLCKLGYQEDIEKQDLLCDGVEGQLHIDSSLGAGLHKWYSIFLRVKTIREMCMWAL